MTRRFRNTFRRFLIRAHFLQNRRTAQNQFNGEYESEKWKHLDGPGGAESRTVEDVLLENEASLCSHHVVGTLESILILILFNFPED